MSEPQTLYEVHIVGVGASGDGDVGVQSIHTRPDSSLQFLEPPGNLQAEPTSSTSINLTWTPPFSVLDVAYYNVSYSSVTSRQASENIVLYVHTSSTGVEIGGLRPFTLYEFKVCTHSHHNRHGPYSQKLECRTMEDVPSVVRDVQCKPLNSSTLRVTWKEPTQANGIISGYTVLYTEDAALPIDKWREHKVPGNRFSTEVIELEPKTRYFLSLRAATQAGWGPPSGLPPSGICNTPGMPDEPTEELAGNTLQTTQHLGFVVGLTIAVGFIVVCMAAVIWRRLCVQRMPPTQAESGVQHVNGNGYYRDWERPQEAELQELELHLATMAPNIPPGNHNLLDTKVQLYGPLQLGNSRPQFQQDHRPFRHFVTLEYTGGYPNGQVNGLKHSFLSNGRIPNGHGNRSKSSVHITENPQVRPSYKCSESPGQLLSSQESKVDDEEDDDDRAMPDQKIPLLGNSRSATVRGEDHTELEEDNDYDHDMTEDGLETADSTQLTDLDVSLNGNTYTGTSSHNSSGNRNGNSGSISSIRDRSSSSTDCVVPKPSHLSVPQ
ncbi:Tyrosine-protein phosphatase Lar [Gryllus bimaculatus]|nr:Tyrosine-protein phosphatase Lar [Gryllus bimaculatus]